MNHIMKRLGAVLALSVGLVGLTSIPAFAWSTQQSASAVCDRNTGNTTLTATFTNTEPQPPTASTAMDVTARLGTASSSPQFDVTKVAVDGQTVTFTKDLGPAPTAGGTVRFDLKWHDGHSGTDVRYATFVATADCRTTVTPVAPSISRSEQCGVPDSATTATTTGVNYSPSGTFQGPANFDVVATPKQGYKFNGAQSVTYHVSLAEARECPRPAARVAITRPTCDEHQGTVTVLNTGNVPVDYVVRIAARKTVTGTLPVGGSRIVKFKVSGLQDRIRADVSYGGQSVASLDRVVKSARHCRPPAHFAPRARVFGPCGDPMYAAIFDNSRSNRAVRFRFTYHKFGAGFVTVTRLVKAGATYRTAYHHVLGGSTMTIRARGNVLLSQRSAPGGNYPSCP